MRGCVGVEVGRDRDQLLEVSDNLGFGADVGSEHLADATMNHPVATFSHLGHLNRDEVVEDLGKRAMEFRMDRLGAIDRRERGLEFGDRLAEVAACFARPTLDRLAKVLVLLILINLGDQSSRARFRLRPTQKSMGSAYLGKKILVVVINDRMVFRRDFLNDVAKSLSELVDEFRVFGDGFLAVFVNLRLIRRGARALRGLRGSRRLGSSAA